MSKAVSESQANAGKLDTLMHLMFDYLSIVASNDKTLLASVFDALLLAFGK
jgi:hypothetical protein